MSKYQSYQCYLLCNEKKLHAEKLNLSQINLSSVEANLLAQAVNQLKEVVLVETSLTPQQVIAICNSMAIDSKLKELNMSCH